MKYMLIAVFGFLVLALAIALFGPRDPYMVAWQECMRPDRLESGGYIATSAEYRMRCLEKARRKYAKDSQ